MTIHSIKQLARTSLKGKWGIACGLTFIVFLITSVIPWAVDVLLSGGFSNWFSQEEPSLAAETANVIISIIFIPLSISVCWFYLSLVRAEGPEISQVFSVYHDSKTFFKLIGLAIVMGIFVFLWSLLLIIPGIIKSISYSQAYFLIKDHPEYTVLEAISESRKRMNGHKARFFLLQLSFIGWAILSLLHPRHRISMANSLYLSINSSLLQ